MTLSLLFTRAAPAALAALLLGACQAGTASQDTAALSGEGTPAARDSQQVPLPEPSAERIKADITWLADDARMGREAGTEGYQASADYVAARFEELGLIPAGNDGSFYQDVPLRGVTRDLDAQAMTIAAEGETIELSPMEDFLMGASALRPEAEVTAPVVFVGQGIVAPDFGINDYAGIDAEGKIVVAFSGVPDGLPSEVAAHYGSAKDVIADEQGAVGYITVYTDEYEERRPWDRTIATAGSTGITWVAPNGEGFTDAPGLIATAYMSQDGSAKLFEAAGISFADLQAEQTEEGVRPAARELPISLTMKAASTYSELTSPNVVGMIEGSDPDLSDEYVVLTAHLDHVGVRQNIDPEADNINNGAMDNAGGVSVMLEEARLFQEAAAAGNPPRRSIVFLALTAEEKGLVGSEYYAYNPTVPLEDIVANVNLDMPLILYDFIDVIAWGAAHSSLGDTVDRAIDRIGLDLIPDPVPEMSIFTRSDHYRFVQQGVPSVFLFTGFGNGGEEAFWNFMNTNYHQPGDDLTQPIDYDAGAKFALVNYLITREIADAQERPTWNDDSFFGELFGSD